MRASGISSSSMCPPGPSPSLMQEVIISSLCFCFTAAHGPEPIIHDILMKNIGSWNHAIRRQTSKWQEFPGTSALLFSAREVFDDILDRPEHYGFAAKDTYTRGGGIWADHVHPTEAVHRIVFEAFKANWRE